MDRSRCFIAAAADRQEKATVEEQLLTLFRGTAPYSFLLFRLNKLIHNRLCVGDNYHVQYVQFVFKTLFPQTKRLYSCAYYS
jgi:hypothetical protein